MTIIQKITEHRDLKHAYMECFSTPSGKKVLAHLLKVSGATHPKLSADADQIRWNEAQRHFVLSIFNMVHGSLDKLPDYLVEQLKANERESTT